MNQVQTTKPASQTRTARVSVGYSDEKAELRRRLAAINNSKRSGK